MHFLHVLLLSRLVLCQTIPLQSGTSLPRISPDDVLSVKLPIPSDLGFQTKLGFEAAQRLALAKQLRVDAEDEVAKAKQFIESLILQKNEIVLSQ